MESRWVEEGIQLHRVEVATAKAWPGGLHRFLVLHSSQVAWHRTTDKQTTGEAEDPLLLIEAVVEHDAPSGILPTAERSCREGCSEECREGCSEGCGIVSKLSVYGTDGDISHIFQSNLNHSV